MSALDVAMYITAAAAVAVTAVLSLGGPRPLGILLWSVFTLLVVALVSEALAKLHLHLPSEMTVIDQATFWVFGFALFAQLIAGVLSFLKEVEPASSVLPYSEGSIGGVKGGGRGFLWWLYTVKRTGSKPRGAEVVQVDSRTFASPLRWIRLPDNEIKGLQLLLRQLSILSLAVMGIIRFAAGEPILNFFGA